MESAFSTISKIAYNFGKFTNSAKVSFSIKPQDEMFYRYIAKKLIDVCNDDSIKLHVIESCDTDHHIVINAELIMMLSKGTVLSAIDMIHYCILDEWTDEYLKDLVIYNMDLIESELTISV